MKKTILVLLTLLISAPLTSHAAIEILITQPEDVRFPIAVTNLAKGDGFSGSGSMLKDIAEVIRNDLKLSGYFFVISPSIYKDRSPVMDPGAMPWGSWEAIGARGLIKGIASTQGGRTMVELRLFDTGTHALQTGKQYTFDRNDWRIIAHRFADEVLLATTGIRGPFATKIAYTMATKKANRKRGEKQIYVMDADGYNPHRVTTDRNSLSLGANWAPDGRHLTYASYVGGFPDIYVLDLQTGQRRRLTANMSTNITPAFSPDGSLVAYASGQGTDMEIYVMTNIGSDEHAFAPAFGIDIAPTFSPDGSEIVFASERGGKLNLYRKSLYGEGAGARITFSGSHNDSPDWSPDGTKIVFTRFAGKYDIFVIDPDGSNMRQVTHVGSNEHPRWAPDSRFITFSSLLGNKSQIYLMRFDGAHKAPISKGKDSTLPDWGPWPEDYWEVQ